MSELDIFTITELRLREKKREDNVRSNDMYKQADLTSKMSKL
jgi:hypothetical protein